MKPSFIEALVRFVVAIPFAFLVHWIEPEIHPSSWLHGAACILFGPWLGRAFSKAILFFKAPPSSPCKMQ